MRRRLTVKRFLCKFSPMFLQRLQQLAATVAERKAPIKQMWPSWWKGGKGKTPNAFVVLNAFKTRLNAFESRLNAFKTRLTMSAEEQYCTQTLWRRNQFLWGMWVKHPRVWVRDWHKISISSCSVGLMYPIIPLTSLHSTAGDVRNLGELYFPLSDFQGNPREVS